MGFGIDMLRMRKPVAAGGGAYGLKSFVAMSGLSNPSVTSVAASMPAGIAVGDLLLAHIVGIGNNPNTVISPPAGWTQIDHKSLHTVTDWAAALFYRIADGTEGASATFSFNQSVRPHWAVTCVGGTEQSPPYEGLATQGGGSGSPVAPATTTTEANELVLHFYASGITGAGSAVDWLTPGAGWTQYYDVPKDNFSAQGEANIGMSYQIIASAGAVASETATITAGPNWRTFTIGIKPA